MINYSNVSEITVFIYKLIEEINLLVDENVLPVKYKYVDVGLHATPGSTEENFTVSFTPFYMDGHETLAIQVVFQFDGNFNVSLAKKAVMKSFLSSIADYFNEVFQYTLFNFGLEQKKQLDKKLDTLKEVVTSANYRVKLRKEIAEYLEYLADENIGA